MNDAARRGRLWLMVAVIALGATSCDKVKELALGKKAGERSAGKRASETGKARAVAGAVLDAPSRALRRKLNRYVVCINGVSASAHRSHARYLGWVNATAGPTNKEPHVYGLYALTQLDGCRRALDQLEDMPPATPVLDAAVVAYRATLEALAPRVETARAYYDGKAFTRDAMKQGKAMHAPLMTAFNDFLAADRMLRDAVSAKSDALAERDLVRLARAGGKRLRWYTQAMMLRAKIVVRTGDAPDLATLDPRVFETRLKNFEQSVIALNLYARKHKAEMKKALPGSVTTFNLAVSDAKKLGKAGRALLDRVAHKRPFDDGEKSQIERSVAWMVDGHPAQLMRAYNALVDRSNHLRWR